MPSSSPNRRPVRAAKPCTRFGSRYFCAPSRKTLRLYRSLPKLRNLSDVFEPAEARRLVEKLEFHYTPKHSPWLNMAEIELNILQRQCLKRRIATEERLHHEVAVWEQHRNAAQETIDWRFTITNAREKLKRLYPTHSLR